MVISLSCVFSLFQLAVWQQNLSAVHEIWREYVKHYSFTIFSLQKFIRSFSRLGDLKSAYETLQHMVALAIRRIIFVNRTAEEKLYSSRLDIPILSNDGLGGKFDLEGNEHSVPSIHCRKIDTYPSNIEQCTPPSMGNREAESGGLGVLNKYENRLVMKVLRWSFSDVIHACAQARNCGLAEQLIVQVG